MTDKLLYEINPATEVLGIGRSKLYELIAAGEIETVVVGRRRLIPRQALESFVERLRENARPAA